MIRDTEVTKELMTQAIRLVIIKREIEHHPSFIDGSYVASKKWSSPLDFRANRDLMALLRALRVDLDAVHKLYADEELESPIALEQRDPINDDDGGEGRALDKLERAISIAETDFEEDSQFKTGDGPL